MRSGRKRPKEGPSRETSTLDRAGVLEALETGIAEALPGIEILDRDLLFDGEGRADLAAVAPGGRLVLVLVAEGEGDRTALEALDLVAFARRNLSLLVRHLGSRRLDPGATPRVVIVDPTTDSVLARRLGALCAVGVDLFGVRTLASAAGERSYLVTVSGARPEAAPAGHGVDAFLDALPLPLRPVGQELTDRMTRLDEDLFVTADPTGVVWRWQGEVLARLECGGDHLTASVAPAHRPAAVRGTTDVEVVLEDALARIVAEIEPEVPGLPPGEPGLYGSSAPLPDEPLLTAEELEAFRD